MPTTDLIPTSDAARRLSVNVRTVHRMVADGRLAPVVKAPGLRGALMFDPADVEALAAAEVSA